VKEVTRLFLSADIAGSTAYKQKKQLEGELATWPAVFVKFFLGLPGHFRAELDAVGREVATKYAAFTPAPEPVMWKAIGDELVFWQEVRSELQVAVSVLAWKRAFIRYREGLKGEPLDVKGAAWTASFPYPNRELAVPRHLSAAMDPGEPITTNENNLARPDDFILDFIGPNIDVGFRIASRSTPRKMQVSLEVADVLASVEQYLPEYKLFYGGTEELKGVHRGRPYPTFWLDTAGTDRFAIAEDELLDRKPAVAKQIWEAAASALEAALLPTCWLAEADNQRFRSGPKGEIDRAVGLIEEHVNANPETPLDSPGDVPSKPLESALSASEDVLERARDLLARAKEAMFESDRSKTENSGESI
jgi:hypothetical protein